MEKLNITSLHLYDYDINNVSWLFIASIVLISSMVIADQNISLDLDLALDSGNIDTILSRQDWREPKKEESNWRQNSHEESSKHTWGAVSLYEDNKELEPIIPGVNEPSGVIDTRKAAPKLQLRF